MRKAQVSIEYLIVLTMMLVVAALVLMISINFVNISDSIKQTGNTFVTNMLEMI
jgi:archaellin